ncbi:serine/threonine-protein kinase [Chlorogloeopsis sp. ULAP01]|uniref:serine/threonine-protein kinase n=1 Tax=Chlorogloeopsis sp. ULAP01 TaxID=3056483 RepID=UPI0025AB1282|nr:serine/threonine-protein kinase [Chlorogloeopsis sp. ULAP01]MDM9380794.1 serine/threonine-protein kinase [Chlorogloeopsis sp. ULAP01]
MICCLNPDCPYPLNPDGMDFCQTCNTPLVALLRNRFHVTRVLSDEGGFGRTYLAEDLDKLNERCVIKQLAPKFQDSWALSKAMDLFHKEAQRLQQLGEHSQIPTLLAYFEENNYLYLVQQFIDGQNLLKELQQKRGYSAKEVREILLDLLPVLKFIHERGVIHRDIKPQNIIRRKSDGRLCLIDFGSSKQLTAKVQIPMGTSIGSHGYSAIEQIRDGKAYPASDLFSLGATCFHLLTGVSPFKLWTENGYAWAQDWREFLKNPISDELAEVIDKLLEKDVKQRYQSADQVLKDLFPKQTSLTKQANTPTDLPQIQPTLVSRKYTLLRNFFLFCSVILLLVLGQFFYRQSGRLELSISSSFGKSHHHADSNKIIPQTEVTLRNFYLANTFKSPDRSVLSVAFDPHGKTIVSNSGNTIKMWSLATGQEIYTLKGHTGRVNIIAMTLDGQTLVSGSEDKTIKLWNLARGQEIRTLDGYFNSVRAFAISPDGKTLAIGGDGNTIKLWDLTTGQQIRTLRSHSSWVSSVAFSPDGQTLASGSRDKTIKLWNLANGETIRTFTGHSQTVTSIAITPDGNTLVSGSEDKTIKLWNLDTGQQIRTLREHSDQVNAIAITSDGHILASGSLDQTIKLWNLDTGEEIQTLEGHDGKIQSLTFSQDGKTLVSSAFEHTIKVWRMSD